MALTLKLVTSQAALLKWQPQSGNAAAFVLECKLLQPGINSPWVTAVFVDRYPFELVDENLQRNTSYLFRLKARNSFGDSGYSQSIPVTTELGTNDITSTTHIAYGPLQKDPATGLYTQTLTVTNNGSPLNPYPDPSPVFLVLNQLQEATLVNADGMTRDRTYLKNAYPYITVTTGDLAAGTSVDITLQFAKTGDAITFTPLVLADELAFTGGGSD